MPPLLVILPLFFKILIIIRRLGLRLILYHKFKFILIHKKIKIIKTFNFFGRIIYIPNLSTGGFIILLKLGVVLIKGLDQG